jgi:hypothetical protein
MAIDLSIDTDAGIAFVQATGDCDMVATLAAMYRLAFDFRFRRVHGILVDVREATSNLRADETYALTRQQARNDMFASRRIALVVRPEGSTAHTAKEMRRLAAPGGPQIEVFTEPAAALSWVSSP